jgi:ankyrin repeat and LEM domain-containing protein 1
LNLIYKNIFKRSDKLKHILDLWDQGRGVISLHVFNNVHSAEALVREGAMIDAIGSVNNIH